MGNIFQPIEIIWKIKELQMKKLFFILLLFIVGCQGAQDDGVKTAWTKIDSGALLIDVRTQQEFDAGHLDEAILIPFDQIGNRIENVESDKERDIVVYCRSGRRSGIAKETLEKMGYKNVTNGGGLNDLQNFRQKMEK